MKSFKTPYQTIALGIEALFETLALCRARKVLLVVDSSFPYLSIREQVESMPVSYVLFDEFTPNPLYEDVCKGVNLYRNEQCDAIVAVGGGSSIDVAKCIKLYCKMDPAVNYLQQECFDSQIPLLAIPTTAGTGSESTRFAVIYFEGKKQSVNHISIIPTYAILESSVLRSLPQYQKKCTVMDAFCQGIESWWSVNSSEESQLHSRLAVKALVDMINPYVFGTGDEEEDDRIASSVMFAANQAGQAINLTQTTAPHAFSYKLTSMYHLPHGHAVAVCLPAIWRYMLDHPERCVDSRGKAYVDETFWQISQALHCRDAEEGVVQIRTMLISLGLHYPVSVNREDELQVLATSVNPVRLKNNPVAIDELAAKDLYDRIVKNDDDENLYINR